jgi:peptidoglycan/xylan/chitin deacetylase (PgdA/CDA1 family)
MLVLKIPYNNIDKRKWIANVILRRFSDEYRIECHDENFWALEFSGTNTRILFQDLMIPALCKNCKVGINKPWFWSGSSHFESFSMSLPVVEPEDAAKEVSFANPINRFVPDLFGMAFWSLSLWDECFNTQDKDIFERCSAKNSYLFLNNLLSKPWVDLWVLWLRTWMEKNVVNLKLKAFKPKISLSHDVDAPFAYALSGIGKVPRRVAGDILLRKNFLGALTGPFKWLFVKAGFDRFDPFYTFDDIMDASEKYNITSTFNFIPISGQVRIDGNYDINAAKVRNLILKIHQRGHSIGLHPSFNSYLSFEQLSYELGRLNSLMLDLGIQKEAWSSRQHFLRFNPLLTPTILDSVGVNCDSSIGYADQIGFRAGTCWRYQMYDLRNDMPLKIIQEPLIVMDVTLMNKSYMNLSLNKSTLSLVDSYRKACFDVGGVFSLLWHNNQLDSKDKREFYFKLLEKIA